MPSTSYGSLFKNRKLTLPELLEKAKSLDAEFYIEENGSIGVKSNSNDIDKLADTMFLSVDCIHLEAELMEFLKSHPNGY